ncbi:MAG: hypothetical protein M9938_00860 [Solirubrobacterales bacterium]|nr:hypothetical protein [Solirubrobacterales bacterium]
MVSAKFWNARLDIPFEYYWDSVFSLGRAKAIIDHGGLFTNLAVGAPFGQQALDFYPGDLLDLLMLRVPGVWTDNPAVVVNLVWLAGFPLTGAAAWWAMHSIGISRRMALTGGVLFALLPYHFWRGESHLNLSAYFIVPLACWMVLQVLNGTPFLTRTGSRWRLTSVIVICVVVGLSGVYYSAMAAGLLLFASLVSLISPDRRRASGHGLAAAVLIGVVLLLGYLPALIYQADHGSNREVAERTVAESEHYGMSLAQLVLPATNHRLEPLAELKAEYLDISIASSGDAQSLGLLGTIGLVWILLVVLSGSRGASGTRAAVERQAGVATLMAFIIATIGGISVLFSLLVMPEIRGWNRMSIFVGFFALIGFVSLWSRLDERLRRMKRGSLLSFGAIGLILMFGVWDQTPARWPNQFNHPELERMYSEDAAFVKRVETHFPDRSMIFQIPYLKYPEAWPLPGTMADYDPMKGFIHSDDLRWSYGAMKGRSADLGACVKDLPVRELVPVITAWGYAGLWIDLAGYRPGQSRQILTAAQAATGSRPLRSGDSRIAVFDLSAVPLSPARRTKLRNALPADGDAPINCGAIHRATAHVNPEGGIDSQRPKNP